MGQTPSINDKEYDLWWAVASNFYNHASNLGVIGSAQPPQTNDNVVDLMRKVATYTASLA